MPLLLPHVPPTGFECLNASGWRALARAWPRLSVLRLGGSAACSAAALQALPAMLPAVPQASSAAAVSTQMDTAATWEDVAAELLSDSDGNNSSDGNSSGRGVRRRSVSDMRGLTGRRSSSSSSNGCSRLRELRALVWRDAPREAAELIAARCPRVLLNPPMAPDRNTGRAPPQELDGSTPLDEPTMALVAPSALQV
jgi:hypothetical protein